MAKYMVDLNYNGVHKDFYFNSKKEADDFIYRQIIKGCNPRNLKLQKLDKGD